MSDVAVKVEGLSKKFCMSLKKSMLYGTYDVARDMLGVPKKNVQLRKSEFWALQDIDFELKRGEKAGFLGENGSGKTTLLRLLNGIFPPDKGRITINGRIGALIAVGAGFHPYMTGRENIYLNGTILGMSRKEIDKKLDEIVDFAEIGNFIDAPVATYSSGMTVRLGFSIAIHGHVDIMLVDEILAVGDLAFQLKCLRKLSEFRSQGGTFIIVSHNMQVIRNSCDKAIWLDKGRILTSGDVYDVCDKYEAAQIMKNDAMISAEKDTLNIIHYDDLVRIPKVEFYDKQGAAVETFSIGDFIKVRIFYHAQRNVLKPIFTVSLQSREGTVVFECYSDQSENNLSEIIGNGYIDMDIETLNIKAGVYDFTITLSENNQFEKLAWHDKAYKIVVIKNHYHINQGMIYPYPKWGYKSK